MLSACFDGNITRAIRLSDFARRLFGGKGDDNAVMEATRGLLIALTCAVRVPVSLRSDCIGSSGTLRGSGRVLVPDVTVPLKTCWATAQQASCFWTLVFSVTIR